jgi:hypothetical protein
MTKKKKKKAKVISSPIVWNVPTAQTATVNTPPPYEDSGVRYQGYYKKQISGNTWELKKQKAICEQAILFGGGAWGNQSLPLHIQEGKTRFFLTTLQITSSPLNIDIDLQLLIQDAVTYAFGFNDLVLQVPANSNLNRAPNDWGGNTIQSIEFNPPKVFNKGFSMDLPGNAANYPSIFTVTAIGFLEEI